MVQAEKCSYHSEILFSGKGLPSSTALEPSGVRKKISFKTGSKTCLEGEGTQRWGSHPTCVRPRVNPQSPARVRRDSIHTRGVEYGDTVQENTEAS